MLRTFATYSFLAVLALVLVRHPVEAAHATEAFAGFLGGAADSLSTFVSSF